MDKGLETSRRKDKVLQTRVPAGLVAILQEEAKRRRVSVSHLIRALLEDTFEFAQALVSDPTPLAERALRLALAAQASADAGGDSQGPGVIAWQRVVLNRRVHCSDCRHAIARGAQGLMGVSDGPPSESLWLCQSCSKKL